MLLRNRRRLLAWTLPLAIAIPLVTLELTCQAIPPAVYSGTLREDRGFFILYGDSRDRLTVEFWREDDDLGRREVIRRLAEEEPDFIVNTGDLVANGSNAASWERFDVDHAAIRERDIPYFPGLGNHEYWGDAPEGLNLYFGRFPFLLGRKWYDLRYKGLLLLVLDSNETKLARYEREAELRWIQDQLDQAEKDPGTRAVFLLTHHPPFTNSTVHDGSDWVRDAFLPLARSHPKVRAFFSGHVHSYERFLIDGIHCVVSGGGGAPPTPVKGRNGTHVDLFEGPELRRFHYCRISVSEKAIHVDVQMQNESRQWSRADGFEIPLP